MTRTNVFTLLTVLVRCAALVILVNSAVHAVVSMATWIPSIGGEQRPDWTVFGAMALMLGSAAVLWVFADLVARLALARPDGQVFESTLEPQAWQSIAFASIGLWMIVSDGSTALRWLLFRFVMRDTWHSLIEDQQRDFVLGLIGNTIGIAIGIGLLLGSRGLAAALHRIRYGSTLRD